MKEEIVEVYVKTSCSSSRKAQDWFKNENIPHRVHYITKEGVSEEFVKKVLALSTNGTKQVVKKSVSEKLGLEELNLKDFIDKIVKNPTLLKTPIILDLSGEYEKLEIGFNDDEIRKFIPRSRKKHGFKLAQMA